MCFETIYQKFFMVDDLMSPGFLKSKINQIRSAIISNEEKMTFGFPTCIGFAINVDEIGNIWFLLDINGRHIKEENFRFPVNLRFFRKGYPFTLTINGEAGIVSDVNKINSVMRKSKEEADINLGTSLMIKVEILSADYYEWEPKLPQSQLKANLVKSLEWCHLIKPAFTNKRLQTAMK